MTAMTTDGTLGRAALQGRIDALPRVRLAHLPTPLDHCPRLGEALGGVDVWIKRDDLTGLAFGGNKTRQLEFLFADILAQGADTVVAGAYTQSNWCRQITGAAKKLGLEVALVLLHGEKGPALQGNLLLDRADGGRRHRGRSRQHGAPHAAARGEGRRAQARRAQALRRPPVRPRQAGARRRGLRQRRARARRPARGCRHRGGLPLSVRRQHDARGHGAGPQGAWPPHQADQRRPDRLERAPLGRHRACRDPPRRRAWIWT